MTGGLTPGKYGCTSSHYDARSGMWEFRPRGSFVIAADGSYSYDALGRPSSGRYVVDAASGKATFRGGAFDGGEATPIAGRQNELLLVAPRLDTRYKCGLVR